MCPPSGATQANGHAGTATSAESVFEMARQMESAGFPDASTFLMEKAILAENSGGFTSNPFIPPSDGALQAQLFKGLNRSASSPSGTPMRINETLLHLGAYTGIREPTEASSLTFAFLQRVARFPIIEAIIRTRKYQATRFAKSPLHTRDTGFEIRMRDKRAKVSRVARRRIEELTDLMLYGGYRYEPNGGLRVHPVTHQPGVWDGNGQEEAPGLFGLVSSLVRDMLSMDWACYRKEAGGDSKKYPVAFFAPVDSATIRRTLWQKYRPQIPENKGKRIQFVEANSLVPGGVVREYTWEGMAAIVRNPSRDLLGPGYGLSEVEIVLDIVSSMILGLKYQKEYFDNNHIPPGMLIINGVPTVTGPGEQVVQNIRSQIMTSTGGPDAFWKLITLMFPAGSSGGAEFVTMRQRAGGLGETGAVNQYFTALLNICTAVFAINAEEIGFRGFTTQQNALNMPNPQSMVESSQDKGLKPILEALANSFNREIVQLIDPDFQFSWVNADASDLEQDLNTANGYFNLGFTHNEVRDEMDITRKKLPLDVELWDSCAVRYEQEDFDNSDEWRAKVDSVYEKEGKTKGLVKLWSACRDIPAGSAGAMLNYYQGEVQANLEAIQQKQMEEQGGYADQIASEQAGGGQFGGENTGPVQPVQQQTPAALRGSGEDEGEEEEEEEEGGGRANLRLVPGGRGKTARPVAPQGRVAAEKSLATVRSLGGGSVIEVRFGEVVDDLERIKKATTCIAATKASVKSRSRKNGAVRPSSVLRAAAGKNRRNNK